jgi:hypothetical protein
MTAPALVNTIYLLQFPDIVFFRLPDGLIQQLQPVTGGFLAIYHRAAGKYQ